MRSASDVAEHVLAGRTGSVPSPRGQDAIGSSKVDARSNTVAERNNRNLSDLLQELRVAGLGVQVLFGFLLAIPFTVRFTSLDASQQNLYKATLLVTALSTALLISPVAYHRWVFRRHQKEKLLRMANGLALLGLASVAVAISLAIWLIMGFIGASWVVTVLSAATCASFAVLWFVVPVFDRVRSEPHTED